MKQVFIKKGEAILENVPAPTIADNEILVRVHYSCISAGTEIAGMKASGKSVYKKAVDKPQYIAQVLENIKRHGLKNTFARVKSKIESKNPIGYSAAGIVLKKGKNINKIKIGDRIACAGAGIANHAEFIAVPGNLAARVPQKVSLKHASTVTLGSIAIQGVRRCNPRLGENIVVIGLGILGQLTSQLLKVSGCNVIGIDLETSRIKKALDLGLDKGINPGKVDIVGEVIRNTSGFGADAVIITAASRSDEVINQAMKLCRKKGKVIIVGDVNLNIKREEFYKKELDLLISTSYGPGRYDEKYEQKGIEYPYAYVRWTENRNMQQYLRLLSEKKIEIDKLIERVYKVEQVSKAYEELNLDKRKPLMVILEYNEDSRPDVMVSTGGFKKKRDKINVGVIGAGGFARGMHLPNLQKLGKLYNILAICSKTGGNAESIARQYSASIATTDYKKLLENENIDMVLIATRHNLHAKIAIEAAKSGKAILVEKPMAINKAEMEDLVSVLKREKVLYTVNFNRRFSPFISRAKEIIKNRINPIVVNYRMNVEFLPDEHWFNSEEGGGRNIGEACHIYDLFNYLTEAKVASVKAQSINPQTEQYNSNDNFGVIIKYEDGSICNLIYTSLGNSDYPKEQMEIFFDNKIVYLNDFQELKIFGVKEIGLRSNIQNKGHFEELEKFGESIKKDQYLIPLWQLIQATNISFEVEEQLL